MTISLMPLWMSRVTIPLMPSVVWTKRVSSSSCQQSANLVAGGMEDGTCTIPEDYHGCTCFALNQQRHCREKFHPYLINLKILLELWLQQEMEDSQDTKEAYNTQPVWDSKNCTASADLTKQHFYQIWGTNSAPCAYPMHKHVVPPSQSGSSIECAELFDNHIIKHYPIIKPTECLANLSILDVGCGTPFKTYTCKAAEDNACCFQELKHIVQ